MILRFAVFGRPMVVLRKNGEWLLFTEPPAGIRTRVFDVTIPAELEKDELGVYLADMYHEYASERYPDVRLLR